MSDNPFVDSFQSFRFRYENKCYYIIFDDARIDSDNINSARTISTALEAIDIHKSQITRTISRININLSNNNIGDQGAKVLTKWCKKLNISCYLNIASNGITIIGLEKLITIPKLEKLIITNNCVDQNLAVYYLKLDSKIMNKIQWN